MGQSLLQFCSSYVRALSDSPQRTIVRRQKTTPDLCKYAGRAIMKTVDLRGAYSNTKEQVRALGELREKLPSLDTPEPPSIKRDRPRRARQLSTEQVEQLIADYQAGATVVARGAASRRTRSPSPFNPYVRDSRIRRTDDLLDIVTPRSDGG
jgi:hypothetical protein